MPPEPAPFDPQRILEVLARHQVQYVVIGGYAAVLAGVDVVTRDIDITPATDEANLQRLADALSELHAAIRVRIGEPPVPLPADPRLLARAEIWNLTTDAGDLDVTTRPSGTTGYDDLAGGAYRQPLADSGLHIAIASLEDIIRSKTAAGRAKDLATLPQLRAARERQRESADAAGRGGSRGEQ
ncbi:MAG: hypothetical protein M3076_07185 [Actinomycetota bacterium]|nr:hypothetical protein [Actinomycetota bacterium]